jgi:exosortase
LRADRELSLQPGRLPIADHALTFSPRHVLFLTLVAVSLPAFWIPLRTLFSYALWGDNFYDPYSYTLAIPLIGAALMFVERGTIFAKVDYDFRTGLTLLLVGLTLGVTAGFAKVQLGEANSLSVSVFGLVSCWLAAFMVCYGSSAFRKGFFPLLFLFLTVPLPDLWLDKPIAAVRYGSTEICSMALNLAGIPFVRYGYEFFLNDVSILVARECSGIHSNLAILIISLVAGHLYLTSVWRKVVLILFALPIVCVTNGLRIAGLTLLAEYVDPRFLQGRLHYQGGMAFFALALLLLFAILHCLRTDIRTSFREKGGPKDL